MGNSVAIHESTSTLFDNSAGWPKTAWQAKLPKARRAEKARIMDENLELLLLLINRRDVVSDRRSDL